MGLARRAPDGAFNSNPPADKVVRAEHVLIAIGTDEQLRALNTQATGR